MKKCIVESQYTIYSHEELNVAHSELIKKAKEQVQKAYAPYSGFHVGAAALLANGEIFAASNQENAAYPSGLCAERVCLFYANAQYPDVAVVSLAIVAYTNGEFLKTPIFPCGACRQVLLETQSRSKTPLEVLMCGEEAIFVVDNVWQLVPFSFDKSSLNS